VAIDSIAGNEQEDISGSRGELALERVADHVDADSPEDESTENRMPAEYYRDLQAAAEKPDSACTAEKPASSAWDAIDEAARPPLDALRITPDRLEHILDGDATGGGHRSGTGKPGKTEFPASWSDDKITESILSVGRSPDSAALQNNGRWKVDGVRDEVTIDVIITQDARTWSAYPPPGSPGVVQNPKDK
jgi:hypothetical protein